MIEFVTLVMTSWIVASVAFSIFVMAFLKGAN